MERELDFGGPKRAEAKPVAPKPAKVKQFRVGPGPLEKLSQYRVPVLIGIGILFLILLLSSILTSGPSGPSPIIPSGITYTLSTFFGLNQSVLSKGTIGKVFFSNETNFMVASPTIGMTMVFPVSWDKDGYSFAGDINNDGVDDIMLLADGFLFGFTPVRSSDNLKELLDFGDVYFSRTAVIADADGDGNSEIAVGVRTSVSGPYELKVVDIENNATIASTGLMMDCSVDGNCFDGGNVDADSQEEIVFLGGNGQINVYDFVTKTTIPLPFFSSSNVVVFKNDTDPQLELAFADSGNNNSLTIFDLQRQDYDAVPSVNGIGELLAADTDGEGSDELAYRDPGGKISLYDHDTGLVIVIGEGYLPKAGDFNNDNRLDILFTDPSGYILVYYAERDTLVNLTIAPALNPGVIPFMAIR